MINVEELDYVDRVENKTSGYINRMRIHFKNGMGMSVITSKMLYGEKKLFEIAIYDREGGFSGDYFDAEDHGDDVLGYCDTEKVEHYIRKIGMRRLVMVKKRLKIGPILISTDLLKGIALLIGGIALVFSLLELIK